MFPCFIGFVVRRFSGDVDMTGFVVYAVFFLRLLFFQAGFDAVALLFRRFEYGVAPCIGDGINCGKRSFGCRFLSIFRYGSDSDENAR